MPRRPDPLFIGIGGHVAAIDSTTGEELWRTKLKGSSMVTILPTPSQIFAGASGELFCLDPRSGEIRWHNKLKGLGTGLIAFGSSDAAAAQLAKQQQDAATAAAI